MMSGKKFQKGLSLSTHLWLQMFHFELDSTGMLSGAPAEQVRLILQRMGDLKHVNAIRDGSYIEFGHKGLTIIYGENGSGKTGYARVLKRACSARGSGEEIHPNIFTALPVEKASAKFKITVNGTPPPDIEWKDQGASNDLLVNITVFDARGARVIVDEDNDLSFLPYGAESFERLVSLLKTLRERLETEKPSPLSLQFQDIPLDTAAGRDLVALASATTNQTIDGITQWIPADETGLTTKTARVLELESPDLKKKIKTLETVEKHALSLGERLKSIEKVFAEHTEKRLKELMRSLEDAKAAFQKVTTESRTPEPLSGVGSDAWQLLYEAAKRYSVEEAYKDKPFPQTSPGDRCVFCMQELEAAAQERLRRFLEYMEQTAKKMLEDAQAKLVTFCNDLRGLSLPQKDQFGSLYDELEERNPQIMRQLQESVSGAKLYSEFLLAATADKTNDSPTAPAKAPLSELAVFTEDLRQERAKLQEQASPEELKSLRTELKELRARKALSQRKSEIKEFVSKLQLQKKYEEAIKDTRSQSISKRGKEIVSEEVTPALTKSLGGELKDLEADYLPLQPKTTATEGEVFQKLTLSQSTLPRGAKLTDVLSEGEQRVVAIAGFLAELSNSPARNPIVLDDPVSSLDHRFRDAIAQRLVREANDRQVMVFTHDIAFLLALKTYAAESSVCVTEQTIRRKGKCPGIANSGSPWHAMPVRDRIKLLQTKIGAIENLHGTDANAYNPEAAEIYGLLREAWEAFVEQDLLNGTVKPHEPGVYTQNLRAVSVTTDDYKAIYHAMAKCSRWMTGHKASAAVDVNRPAPKEVRKDIETLAQCSNQIRSTNQERRKERDKAVEPPTTAVG